MVLQQQRRRSYIPSPLGSPAAARRLGQRLGDRLCSSPILSRVKKKWKDGEDQVSHVSDSNQHSASLVCHSDK